MKRLLFILLLPVLAHAQGHSLLITSENQDDPPLENISEPPPGVPGNFIVTAGDTQNVLDWDSATLAATYEIYWSTSASAGLGGTKITVLTGTDYTHTSLSNGTTYYYTVRAVKADGITFGDLTAEKSGKPTAPIAPVTGLELYLGGTGASDGNDGTIDHPKATALGIVNAVRSATGRTSTAIALDGSWEGATIHVADGIYPFTATLEMDNRDAGTASFPINWVADNPREVIFTGAKQVTASLWDAVTGSSDGYGQMDASYRASMYQLNVAALGVSNGSFHPNGFVFWTDYPMLIVGDEMKPLSRYPSGDETTFNAWTPITAATFINANGNVDSNGNPVFDWNETTTVTIAGTTVAGWNPSNQDIMIYGCLGRQPWVKYWQRVTGIALSGGNTQVTFQNNGDQAFATTAAQPTWLAFRNQLNVIGKGEYCNRRYASSDYMTYRPTDAEATAWGADGTRPTTSITNLPTLIRMGVSNDAAKGASYVTFNGIVFEGTRFECIQSYYATGQTFTNCEVRNCGWKGISLLHQTDLTIDGGNFHDLMQGMGNISGGNSLTLTDGGIVLTGGLVCDDTGQYIQSNVFSSLCLSESNSRNLTCGVTVSGVTFSNARDGLLGVATHMTIEGNSIFDRGCMLTGDAGFFSGSGFDDYGYGGSAFPGVVIQNNTIKNGVRHPRLHQSNGPVFAIYAESCWYWTIQDNIFLNDDQAMNMAAGHNNIVRRNKFTTCNLGHYGAPIVFGNRVGKVGNLTQIQSGMTSLATQNEPYLSAYPRMAPFRTGQNEAFLCVYHDDITCVDNMMTDAAGSGVKMFNMGVSGTNYSSLYQPKSGTGGPYQVGVDPSQLNYDIGSSGTPANGGGTKRIDELD